MSWTKVLGAHGRYGAIFLKETAMLLTGFCRGVKNRFGSTNEISVFRDEGSRGLVEVENPSEFMLEGRPEDTSGAIVRLCHGGNPSDPAGS